MSCLDERLRLEDHVAWARSIGNAVAREMHAEQWTGDLVGAALEGLLEASRRYEPRTGGSFRTFAGQRVRGAAMDQYRSIKHSRRMVRTDEVSLDRCIAPEGRAVHGSSPTFGDTLPDREQDDDRAAMRAKLRRLARERLEGDQLTTMLMTIAGFTLVEVGVTLGVTEFRACRILGRARDVLAVVVQPEPSSPASAPAVDPPPAAPSADRLAPTGPLMRTSEVARFFGVTSRSVQNWVVAGHLPVVRTLGGRMRFKREVVLALGGGR